MGTTTAFADTPDNLSMPSATVIPVLQYPDVAASVAWLCAVFGFTERLRIGTHRVQINVGTGAVVLTGGSSAMATPAGHSLMVRVRNIDELFHRASEAGAEILGEPTSYPYGERQFSARDLGGHVWTFSQSVANVPPGDWGGELVSPPGSDVLRP
jgi:uncharacterized glyoxalase superfamily protein PhnB